MFSTSLEMFLKDKRSANTTITRPRKRRANSDSELTFHDTFDRHSSYQDLRSPLFVPSSLHMHEFEDIDFIGGNSNDSNNMLGSTSTMDPSHMFITSPEHAYDHFNSPSALVSPSMESVEYNPLNDENNHNMIAENMNGGDITSLFPAQVFLVNPSPQQQQTTLSIFQQNQDQINDGQQRLLIQLEEPPGSLANALEIGKVRRTRCGPPVLKPKASNEPVKEYNNNVNQQWITMKNDKQALKEQGHSWRTGLWSNEEENLLKENIEQYCIKNNITDIKATIFSSPKDERRKFYRTIARRLNRPLFAVYRKVLRMYDKSNYIGKYSDHETSKLEKYCKTYNKDWNLIGLELGRSASSVKDKARLLNNAKKKGHWDKSELDLLSKSIREQTNTKKGESVTCNVNWVNISKDVATRSEKQCRSKWLNYLNWVEAGGKQWVKTDEIHLIQKIIKSGARKEEQVNWNELANGWNCVRSPQWLRMKWWNIKKNYKEYQKCSFAELLNYLQTTYVEEIYEKLNELHHDDDASSLIGQNDEGVERDQLLEERAVVNSGQLTDQNLQLNINPTDFNRSFQSANLLDASSFQPLTFQILSSDQRLLSTDQPMQLGKSIDNTSQFQPAVSEQFQPAGQFQTAVSEVNCNLDQTGSKQEAPLLNENFLVARNIYFQRNSVT